MSALDWKAIVPKILAAAIAAVLIGAVVLLARCDGKKIGRAGAVIDEQARTIALQEKHAAALENAAAERVADTIRLRNQAEELDDATDGVEGSDAKRRARGCAILRQSGDAAGVRECE